MQKREGRKNPWRVQWRDQITGKVRSQSFPRKKDAEEFEATININKARLKAGLAKVSTDILFFDRAQTFIKKRSLTHPASTWKQDARNFKNYWLEKFGARVMSSMTRQEIKEHLDWIQFELKKSPATRNRHRALIHRMFEEAIEDEVLADNPVSRIPLVDEKKKTRKLGHWKNLAEINSYIKAMEGEGPSFGVGALIMCYAGPRIGEVLALKFGDVDEDNKLITVQRTYERETRKVYERTKGQGDGGSYDVPLFPKVRDAVRLHRSRTPFNRASDFIVQDLDGSHLVYERYNDAHARAIKSAGLQRITLHDLRRTFATVAGKHGLSKEQVQKILGHGSILVTEVYYKTDMTAIIEKAEQSGFGASDSAKAIRIVGGQEK